MLGVIFRKSQNKIQDPAKLRRLVDLINGETWVGLDVDVKGEIYEGLLEKNAEDVKGGAGQYFTPRPLIKAMVEVMQPQPGETIYDPACGTGGFLLAAHDYLSDQNIFDLDKEQKQFLKLDTLRRQGHRGRRGPAVRHEPVPARHRRRGEPHRGGRLSDLRPRRPLRPGAHQSALRQEEQHHHRQRRGQGRQGDADLQPPGFLGHHLQQAAQLPAARQALC